MNWRFNIISFMIGSALIGLLPGRQISISSPRGKRWFDKDGSPLESLRKGFRRQTESAARVLLI
jgi:hypothetical protein